MCMLRCKSGWMKRSLIQQISHCTAGSCQYAVTVLRCTDIVCCDCIATWPEDTFDHTCGGRSVRLSSFSAEWLWASTPSRWIRTLTLKDTLCTSLVSDNPTCIWMSCLQDHAGIPTYFWVWTRISVSQIIATVSRTSHTHLHERGSKCTGSWSSWWPY